MKKMVKTKLRNSAFQQPRGWVALSSLVRRLFVVCRPAWWHLLSSPLYDVLDHTNHIFSESWWHPLSSNPLPTRGKTLCQNNRQLIGMPLIGLARQAKNRSQLYFLLKSSLSIWAYGGVKDHIMELWTYIVCFCLKRWQKLTINYKIQNC